MPLRFIGLSTGRAGSRYLAGLLNAAGVKTLHEVHSKVAMDADAQGEISAHFVTQMEPPIQAEVWHFSRHPQPFVSSLMKFNFWAMNAPSIHPYLRRTGDAVADSFLYWVDWNRRILDLAQHPQRTSFRIEDVNRDLIFHLAASIGVDANGEDIDLAWDERQAFAEIPASVAGEVADMMEELGYAQAC